MYEQFFKFSQRPFAATPSSHCFVATSATDESLTQVEQCLTEGRGIALLTASSGMGKTLFCQQLIERSQSHFQTAFLANAQFPTRRSFLQTILYELGHGYIRHGEDEVRIILKRLLKSLVPPRSAALLVIDEADHLSKRMLDEVRGLSNLIEEEMPLLRILLCGPHALEEKLLLPENNGCYQRIACQVTLESLTIQESINYIDYRLQRVGSSLEKTIQPEALEAICQASDGSPRALNQLCDHSLMLGYLTEQSTIDLPTVLEALDDLKHLPLCWNEPTAAKVAYSQLCDNASNEIEEVDDNIHFEHSIEIDDELEDSIDTNDIVEVNQSPNETATFEVGSFEVGAEIETAQPEETMPVAEACSFETESVEDNSTIEIVEAKEEQQSSASTFEIGADVITIEESTILLDQETTEPDLLVVQVEEPDICDASIRTEQQPAVSEEATIEIVFDRYALIDSGDPDSSNCINLTEAIVNRETTSERTDSVSHEQTSSADQNESQTLEVELSEEVILQKNDIRSDLIQVCEETREVIGHQLNLLEEIWETSDINHENVPPETYELEPSLDLFSDNVVEGLQAESKPAIDLTAMRQRLSQRFKQLRRKQG